MIRAAHTMSDVEELHLHTLCDGFRSARSTALQHAASPVTDYLERYPGPEDLENFQLARSLIVI